MNANALDRWFTVATEHLWRTSLEATVLIALVWIAQSVFAKSLKPKWRYALSFLILVRLALPVVPESGFSIFNLAERFQKGPPPPWAGVSLAPSNLALPNARIDPLPLAFSELPYDKPHSDRMRRVCERGWLLGAASLLLIMSVRHQRFSNWMRRRTPTNDPHLLAILEASKIVMRWRGEVRLLIVPLLATPAIFGWRQPQLLIPERLVKILNAHELKLVILHELAHVKRGDVLLNWIMICVRAAHWFNPLVWLAMRRLRSDRELVCDEMVMTQLAGDERHMYGNTLIKLAAEFSKIGSCPSLVAAINHKNEIKRRIRMIANFSPITRRTLVISTVLVAAVCCFTFTRAAEKKPKTADPAPRKALGNEPQGTSSLRAIDLLEKQLKKHEAEVSRAEERLTQMRRELKITDLDTQSSILMMGPEVARQIERERISVAGHGAQLETTLNRLKNMAPNELRESLPTINPDSILSTLLEKYNASQNELATLSPEAGPGHPRVQAATKLVKQLNEQIDARVKGILQGLETQAASSTARALALSNQVEQARRKDAENMEKYRPFFQAKRDLETHHRIRETIKLRILQETIDANLSPLKAETITRQQIDALKKFLELNFSAKEAAP